MSENQRITVKQHKNLKMIRVGLSSMLLISALAFLSPLSQPFLISMIVMSLSALILQCAHPVSMSYEFSEGFIVNRYLWKVESIPLDTIRSIEIIISKKTRRGVQCKLIFSLDPYGNQQVFIGTTDALLLTELLKQETQRISIRVTAKSLDLENKAVTINELKEIRNKLLPEKQKES